jgi:subtilisin-like proprotein convertase family protein
MRRAFLVALALFGVSALPIRADRVRIAAQAIAGSPEADLRLVDTTESLTGTHLRFRQYVEGLEVVGSDVSVEMDRHDRVTAVRGAVRRISALAESTLQSSHARAAVVSNADPGTVVETIERVIFAAGDELRPAFRVIARAHPLMPWAWFIDAGSGSVLRKVPLFATRDGRVFDPNPVTTLNNPALQDQDDSAPAVPDAAYRVVELPDLASSGPIAGPNVRLVELQPPSKTVTDVNQSLLFDRSADGFEEVMAYFHLDRSQRYMQSLGYTGTRRIIDHPIEVDAHAASGADNSFYVGEVFGAGRLYFGEGGVDDAEDADILLHEYGHAIQDAIVPGAFFGTAGSQASAMGEGFGDYWAFSGGYAESVRTGRDPFCIGDWDARCSGSSTSCGYAPGSDCLRRVDSTKTMDNYINSEQGGTQHRNGEIWSSALRRFFMAMIGRYGPAQGRPIADRLVLEGHFGLVATPTFKAAAGRMLEADRVLYGGLHNDAICAAMVLGKIMTQTECGGGRRGELTFLQSTDRDRAIPDADTGGITSSRFVSSTRTIETVSVQVRIQHPFRGDLRIILIAPDGRTVLLRRPANEPGANLDVTYGLDVEPAESLAILRGMPANGEWRLRVMDEASRDVGALLSWGLVFRFQGDEPFLTRPAMAGGSRRIPVVAKTPGAEGTNFLSDVRIFNGGTSRADVIAVFTPTGSNGIERFSAMRMQIEAGQTLALDDVLGSTFGTFGTGSLEVQGDVANLVVTSRTYNRLSDRTYGQFIGEVGADGVTSPSLPPLHVPQLRNTDAYRSNLGITNVSGEAATVRVQILDDRGGLLETQDLGIAPFGHVQFGILGGRTGRITEVARAVVHVLSGGSVAAYGSVVDNVSGDSIYVPGVRQPAPRQARIAVGVRSDGANNTRWRTDLWLTNVTSEPRSITVTFFSLDGTPNGRNLSLAANESRVVEDVVQTLFGMSAAMGQIAISESDLLVTSRTWTPGTAGTYGQFIGSLSPAESLRSGAAHSIQVESSARFRTNIGVAEVGGNPVVVRVRVFDAGGNERSSHLVTLAPNGLTQFNPTATGIPPLTNGRITFDLIGSGAILGYASVVDNVSGDPIYVPAE